MATSIELLHVEPGLRIGLWESLVMVDGDGQVTVAAIREMGRAYKLAASRCAGGTAGLTRILSVQRPSGPDPREAAIQMLREVGDPLRCIVTVLEAGGIQATVARATLRALNVVVRGPTLLAAQTLEEGAEAIVPFLSRMWARTVSSAEVSGAFHGLGALASDA